MERTKLEEFLEREDYEGAADCALKTGAEEFATLLPSVSERHLQPLCRALDSELLAQTLVLLDAPLQSKIISVLRDDELQEVMDGVSVDDTVEMIGDMPEKLVRRIAEKEEIVRLFEERRFSVLKPLLASMNATDVAAVFEEVEDEDLPVLFRILPKD
ncbi:MAG: magnesium transporter MgtE N-terminal domain-containing protein, partial [Candidatus Scatosoma sp.]